MRRPTTGDIGFVHWNPLSAPSIMLARPLTRPRMPSTQAATADVISDFVSSYIDSVLSGRCRDDQYGLAFMLAKSGYMFMAVDPDPVVDSDPTSLAPRDRFPVLAHAVFKPQPGRVTFSAPNPNDGTAPAAYEMHDPVYIRFQRDGSAQLWLLSMNRLDEEGEPILCHRADPATLVVHPSHAIATLAAPLQTLH